MTEIPIRRRDPGDALRIFSDEVQSEMTTDTILIELVNAIAKLQESHDEIKETVAEINMKVQPMLDGLSESMVGKLLGMGGK